MVRDGRESAPLIGPGTVSFGGRAPGHPKFKDNPLDGQFDRCQGSFENRRIVGIEPLGPAPDQLRIALNDRQWCAEPLRK